MPSIYKVKMGFLFPSEVNNFAIGIKTVIERSLSMEESVNTFSFTITSRRNVRAMKYRYNAVLSSSSF